MRTRTRRRPIGIDLHIYEDNPVLQIDHFYADTLYVPLGANVSLAIQNGDDETRVFTLSQFGINVTIVSGTTQRVTLTANTLGNFSFISPITPPSAASAGRQGPCLEGVLLRDAERDAAVDDHLRGDGCAADGKLRQRQRQQGRSAAAPRPH